MLNIHKPSGPTSHDVVARVRRATRVRKVGHAGTLDPLASGLMIICTGKSTKLIELFQAMDKEYLATLKLGATTPSLDLETNEENHKPYDHVTPLLMNEVLKKFEGETQQIPPIFSAVKVNGKRAFDYARNGEELKLNPKNIVIKEIVTESFNLPYLTIRVICSKGTYIRALARDIGNELRCGSYLTELKRTRIGKYKVEDAITIKYFLENIDIYVTN